MEEERDGKRKREGERGGEGEGGREGGREGERERDRSHILLRDFPPEIALSRFSLLLDITGSHAIPRAQI